MNSRSHVRCTKSTSFLCNIPCCSYHRPNPCNCRHSFEDDACEKHKALQDLGEQFEIEHGRQPSVWIDHLCMNQNEIEDDLKCLPFFIMGCNKLLLLLGHNFEKDFWCVCVLALAGLEFVCVPGASGSSTPFAASMNIAVTSQLDGCMQPQT